MPVWNVPPQRDEPHLTVRSWCVIECTNHERYLVGWCEERGEGRVSTAIVSFDPQAMKVKTASGRIYHLSGPPGRDPDGLYVWITYAAVNELTRLRDATSEYWSQWAEPT